jgi:hypothetical protein
MIRYCESFGCGGTNALTNISNDLTHVSISVEMDNNSQRPSHKPLRDQHFRTHSMSYKLSTNTKLS